MVRLRDLACCSLVTLAVLVGSARVSAQGVIDMESGMPDQEAKSHFKVGKTLYESGRFSEAAVEFEKAYQLSNKVELLYNVYVAYRDASDLPRAIDALRRYLELAQLDEPSRLNLQARLRAMEEASQRAAAPTVAEPAEAAPPAAAPAPPPSSEPAQPAAAPLAAAPAPGSAEVEVEPGDPVLPFALIGIGSGALLAGIVTAVMAAGQISDIEDRCPNDVCPPASEFDLAGERDEARTLRTVAFALLGGGVVVGAAGATLLLLDSGEQAAEPGPQATLRCGAGGCLGTVRGQF